MADHTEDALQPAPEPTLKIGRLPSPTDDSRVRGFASNVKDFLTERPVNLKGARPAVFNTPAFGESLTDNLKEFFRAAPRGQVNSDLLINWNAGFGGFWQNLRDTISPPKLAPLKTTSQPVAVPELWSKNTQFTRVQALSLAVHVVILVLIIGPLLLVLPSPSTTKANSQVEITTISPFLPKLPPGAKKAGGGGGGGAHDPLPASRGKLPKFAMTQF